MGIGIFPRRIGGKRRAYGGGVEEESKRARNKEGNKIYPDGRGR